MTSDNIVVFPFADESSVPSETPTIEADSVLIIDESSQNTKLKSYHQQLHRERVLKAAVDKLKLRNKAAKIMANYKMQKQHFIDAIYRHKLNNYCIMNMLANTIKIYDEYHAIDDTNMSYVSYFFTNAENRVYIKSKTQIMMHLTTKSKEIWLAYLHQTTYIRHDRFGSKYGNSPTFTLNQFEVSGYFHKHAPKPVHTPKSTQKSTQIDPLNSVSSRYVRVGKRVNTKLAVPPLGHKISQLGTFNLQQELDNIVRHIEENPQEFANIPHALNYEPPELHIDFNALNPEMMPGFGELFDTQPPVAAELPDISTIIAKLMTRIVNKDINTNELILEVLYDSELLDRAQITNKKQIVFISFDDDFNTLIPTLQLTPTMSATVEKWHNMLDLCFYIRESGVFLPDDLCQNELDIFFTNPATKDRLMINSTDVEFYTKDFVSTCLLNIANARQMNKLHNNKLNTYKIPTLESSKIVVSYNPLCKHATTAKPLRVIDLSPQKPIQVKPPTPWSLSPQKPIQVKPTSWSFSESQPDDPKTLHGEFQFHGTCSSPNTLKQKTPWNECRLEKLEINRKKSYDTLREFIENENETAELIYDFSNTKKNSQFVMNTRKLEDTYAKIGHSFHSAKPFDITDAPDKKYPYDTSKSGKDLPDFATFPTGERYEKLQTLDGVKPFEGFRYVKNLTYGDCIERPISPSVESKPEVVTNLSIVIINIATLSTIFIETPTSEEIDIVRNHPEYGFIELAMLNATKPEIAAYIRTLTDCVTFTDLDELNATIQMCLQFIDFCAEKEREITRKTDEQPRNNDISEKDSVMNYFKFNYKISDDEKFKIKASEICKMLIASNMINVTKGKESSFSIRLANYLKILGLKKKRFNDGFYYYGIEKIVIDPKDVATVAKFNDYFNKIQQSKATMALDLLEMDNAGFTLARQQTQLPFENAFKYSSGNGGGQFAPIPNKKFAYDPTTL